MKASVKMRTPAKRDESVKNKSSVKMDDRAKTKAPVQIKSPVKMETITKAKSPAQKKTPATIMARKKTKAPSKKKTPEKIKTTVKMDAKAKTKLPAKTDEKARMNSPVKKKSSVKTKMPDGEKSPRGKKRHGTALKRSGAEREYLISAETPDGGKTNYLCFKDDEPYLTGRPDRHATLEEAISQIIRAISARGRDHSHGNQMLTFHVHESGGVVRATIYESAAKMP